MGAWIETGLKIGRKITAEVASYMGAWIETFISM